MVTNSQILAMSVNIWKLSVYQTPLSVDCCGRQPAISGTVDADHLNGTNAQDVFLGIDNDDVFKGGRGYNFICGDRGKDSLYGEVGNDKLYGFDGSDKLYGGGNDRLVGGSGLYGNLGADFFDCGSATDTVIDFKTTEGDVKTVSCENF